MPRPLISAAGTAPRSGRLWTYLTLVATGATLVLGALAASAVSTGNAFSWSVLALGLAIVLSHAAVFVLSNRIDALVVGSEEAILVAALLVAPDELGAALVISVVIYPIGQRYLGVTERMRRPSIEKLIFNAATQLIGGAAALATYGIGSRLWTADVPAALLGAMASFLASHVLVVGVIRAATGARSDARESRASVIRASRASVAVSLVGLLIGLSAATASQPAWFVLGSAALLYVAARSLARQAIHVETVDRLLDAAPHVLAPGDVDAQIIEHACRLLACEHGTITATPRASGGMLGVPIAGSEGIPEYLVVEGRLGTHRSFDREDRELLEGLADLAGPARQQRQLVAALERSEASRGAILGALAHDLRSPMAVASSALQSLSLLVSRSDVPAALPLVEAADRNATRALRILDELLALEQAALSPRVRGVTDPAAAAHQVRETYGDLVEVVGGPEISLAVDGRAVGRIMDNLVANAIKHAPGSRVHIGWMIAGDEGLLTVDDDGAGIPEELRATLTGPFRQRDDSVTGVGLGLYLAQRFAELAGGRLEIGESDSGGASMRVYLPVVATGSPADDPIKTGGSGPSSP